MSDILETIGVWLTVLGIITLFITGFLATRAWFWLAVIAIVLLRMHA